MGHLRPVFGAPLTQLQKAISQDKIGDTRNLSDSSENHETGLRAKQALNLQETVRMNMQGQHKSTQIQELTPTSFVKKISTFKASSEKKFETELVCNSHSTRSAKISCSLEFFCHNYLF